MKPGTHILYCRCANAAVIPEEVQRAVSAALAGRADVTTVEDFCAVAAKRDPRLEQLIACERLIVVACHPRAVRWLFRLSLIHI